MTSIDFYILGESSGKNVAATVCQLCNKAYSNNMRVNIQAGSPEQAMQLDELLWRFKNVTFIPHQNLEQDNSLPNNFFIPVIINCSSQIPDGYDDVLINAGADIPPFYSRFERVLEIVGKTEQEKASARERFRFYRDRGYQLQQYDL